MVTLPAFMARCTMPTAAATALTAADSSSARPPPAVLPSSRQPVPRPLDMQSHSAPSGGGKENSPTRALASAHHCHYLIGQTCGHVPQPSQSAQEQAGLTCASGPSAAVAALALPWPERQLLWRLQLQTCERAAAEPYLISALSIASLACSSMAEASVCVVLERAVATELRAAILPGNVLVAVTCNAEATATCAFTIPTGFGKRCLQTLPMSPS